MVQRTLSCQDFLPHRLPTSTKDVITSSKMITYKAICLKWSSWYSYGISYILNDYHEIKCEVMYPMMF